MFNCFSSKQNVRNILKFYYIKGENATNAANKICAVYGPNAVSIRVALMWFKSRNFSAKMRFALDALSQIKSVPSLRKWSKIDILVAMTLLKNLMLILKQFYVICESLVTRKNLIFGYYMISLRET